MQNILESAKHSSILQVAEGKAIDTLNYSMQKSLQFPGVLATQKFSVNCQNLAGGLMSGGTMSVNIPQYGLLRKAFLRFTLTFATGGELCGAPGIFAFSRINLQTTSGTIISTLFPDALWQKCDQQPNYAKLAVAVGTSGNVVYANNATKVLYCPLLFDQFDHPSSWLDTLSLEELAISFVGRNSTDILSAGTASVTACDLQLYYVQPTIERMNMALMEKHPGGASFNYLGFNQFAESRLSQSATSNLIQLYCPSPVYRTIIACRLVADIKKYTTYTAPTSVRVLDSGNTIFNSTAAELLLEAGNNTTNYIIIDWGLQGSLDPDQERATSAVSFFQMSNPTIEVNYDAAVARHIDIFHYTLQAVTVSASPNNRNRQIQVLGDR
jgi:hypothetical protein